MHRTKASLLGTALGLALVLSACSQAAPTSDPSPATAAPSRSESAPPELTASPTAATTPDTTSTATSTATATSSAPTEDPAAPTEDPAVPRLSDRQLADLAVNEVGRVLVSEWHKVGTDTDGDYQNTLATFRDQLQYLYDNGLRPVTTTEYADATFPIPAGTSPVVLTFDDTSPNHLRWADDGVTPHPDSVVGILEEFAATHDDWRATAVFAYNWPPFGDFDPADAGPKLQYLVDNGFELSNHTMDHVNLADLDAAGVQEQIGGNVAKLHELVPDAPVTTLTLPFGMHPTDESLAVDGTSPEGTTYHHDLVFEVGWMPDTSPNHVEHDPTSVMRVPGHGPWGADDLDWWDWVDWLDDEPHRKFVSDGDPATVTYPADFASVAAVRDGLTTRTYQPVDPTATTK